MSILVAGNLVNTGFFLTTKLREKGFDVELLVEKNPPFESDPKNSGYFKSEDTLWIKYYDKSKKNWKFDIIKLMRKYDLIIAITELPMFALLSFKPYISICTGSDLSELVHSKSFKGYLLRFAYYFSKHVIFVLPSQLYDVKKIGLKNALFLPLFRIYHDKEKSKVVKNGKKHFVFFHPTNHIWEIKGNNIFLKAFIKLAKEREDVFLVTINRGEDAQKSINLLQAGDIEGKYEILPSTLNQDKLMEYYLKADVIADQFKVEAFGFIGLEVLNIGKPLICYINLENYSNLYGEKPPVVNSNNSEEIFNLMNKIIDNKSLYEKICKDSRNWFKKFHDENMLIDKYAKLITDNLDIKKR